MLRGRHLTTTIKKCVRILTLIISQQVILNYNMTFLLTISVFNFEAFRIFDSHTPAKWAVFKCSYFLHTADCYLKCSLRMSALMEEFIPSPFFLTEQGFNHFKRGICMATPDSFHLACLPLCFFTMPSLHNSLPAHLYSPSSFLLPQPAHCTTLWFGTTWNLPQLRAQLGTAAEAAAQEYTAEDFVSWTNVSMQSCLSLSFQEILSNLFLPYSRHFTLQTAKG